MAAELAIGCLTYLNVSGNSLSGPLLSSTESQCSSRLIGDDIVMQYYDELVGNVLIGNPFGSELASIANVTLHDFSNNGFGGALPSITVSLDRNYSYGLWLNGNMFNTTLSARFFGFCKVATGVAINLSSNQLSGSLDMLSSCISIHNFDAGYNNFSGSIPADVGGLHFLRRLVLSGNNLTGQIPGQFGDLAALEVLDLSRNSLTGSIPLHLTDASHLQVLRLDHNRLSGTIPPSFSELLNSQFLMSHSTTYQATFLILGTLLIVVSSSAIPYCTNVWEQMHLYHQLKQSVPQKGLKNGGLDLSLLL
jgi:hypothetical protein